MKTFYRIVKNLFIIIIVAFAPSLLFSVLMPNTTDEGILIVLSIGIATCIITDHIESLSRKLEDRQGIPN